MMIGVHSIARLAVLCLMAGQTILVVRVYGDDFRSLDAFRASKMDAYNLGMRQMLEMETHGGHIIRVYEHESQVDKLNNLLVDRTASADPETNFNIILEELIKYYKNGGRFDSKEAQVK